MEVLMVGKAPVLMWAVPHLLSRSGFRVDVITTSSLLCASRFVRDVCVAETPDAMLAQAFERIAGREEAYGWVIACDDETLRSMSEMSWPAGREPKHLPLRMQEPSHIYSKIGLSRVLSQKGVRTPEFRVAFGCREAIEAARELGYPVYLKLDSANGGAGVFPCCCDGEIERLEPKFDAGPMLVQERIEGPELDLSAVYFEGELVHFAYSVVDRMMPSNRLSIVRRYSPSAIVEEDVVAELRALGRALKASGFVTISCIDAADGSGRHYFEADMRPNVWVDVSRYYGEDAAIRIREWFAKGAVLCREADATPGRTEPMTIPYFMRLALWELIVNRYRVWKFIPWADRRVVFSLLWSRIVMPGTRTLVPKTVRGVVRRGMLALRIAFP